MSGKIFFGLVMHLPQKFIEQVNRFGAERLPFFFLIDFEEQFPLLFRPEEVKKLGMFWSFPQLQLLPETPMHQVQASLSYQTLPMPFEEYEAGFNQVMAHLRFGNSFLVNLTYPTPLFMNWPLEQVLAHSDAPYRMVWPGKFGVFSPECFVRIQSGSISSFPMKGTIDASIPDARTRILEDEKEFAEHATIVDLIRNDLSQVARKVEVEDFRFVTEVSTSKGTLLQVSSRISGKLDADYPEHLGSILNALLPAGSVSGAPKRKTLEIIRDAENGPRGYYTGVMGYFDGHNLDSAVMIRFMEEVPGHYLYRSGGGITVYSQADDEYRELVRKVYIPIA